MKAVRIAVSGTFTVEGVAARLRQELAGRGVTGEVRTGGFDTLMSDLTDPAASGDADDPQIFACLLHDDWFLPGDWGPEALDALPGRIRERIEQLRAAITGYLSCSGATVLLHTVPLSPRYPQSLVGQRSRSRLSRIWRELNIALIDLAEQPRVMLVDLEQALCGARRQWRDERLYSFAGMALSGAGEDVYAAEVAAFAAGVAGAAKKLLVLDLDNTLWGGTVGDDGPAGIALGDQYPGRSYRELQRFLRALRRQGVLLAVASRNDEAVVGGVLRDHPEMRLRAADFVAQRVNWDRKDVNIQDMCSALNIGLDSVVFLDDSALERDMVGTSLPEVTVLSAEGDPADLVDKVLSRRLFDVPETTGTDNERTALYRTRAAREKFSGSFASTADYLRSLDIRLTVAAVDDFTSARLGQLRGRTNQFNATGTAYPPAGIADMVLTFQVTDRFGDEGMVGGIWIRSAPGAWVIENFVMSCRVFARQIEHALLQHVADSAIAQGADRLDGLFAPTDRNRRVAEFYAAAGFTEADRRNGLHRLSLPLSPPFSLRPDWIAISEVGTDD
jgi:FkbH-like protein